MAVAWSTNTHLHFVPSLQMQWAVPQIPRGFIMKCLIKQREFIIVQFLLKTFALSKHLLRHYKDMRTYSEVDRAWIKEN
jgi:hypothetical protein